MGLDIKELSPSRETATNYGVGAGEVFFSGLAALGCSKGVKVTGEIVQQAVRSFWEKPNLIPTATPGRFVELSPADIINTEPVIQFIQSCTDSGSKASIAVGFTETFFQFYRYTQSDHTKSWGTDMIEGGYRGATIGAMTGFIYSTENLSQKLASALVGAIFGSIVGNGIAGVSHIFRSIHMPNKESRF